MKVAGSRMKWAGHVQRMGEEHGKQKRVAEEDEEDQSGDGKSVKRDLERAGTNGQEWKTTAEDRGKWRELTTIVEEATK